MLFTSHSCAAEAGMQASMSCRATGRQVDSSTWATLVLQRRRGGRGGVGQAGYESEGRKKPGMSDPPENNRYACFEQTEHASITLQYQSPKLGDPTLKYNAAKRFSCILERAGTPCNRPSLSWCLVVPFSSSFPPLERWEHMHDHVLQHTHG